MKQKLPRDDGEQVAQDALQECVEKVRWPDSDEPGVLWAVVKTVCRRSHRRLPPRDPFGMRLGIGRPAGAGAAAEVRQCTAHEP
jgi:hypothetical protein